MILIDSSGWIEYLTDGEKGNKFFSYLKDPKKVITPTIVLYEVYKKIKKELSEQHALEASAQMVKTQVIPLTEEIALQAADVSLEFSLPMADAIVYTTALVHQCKVVTLDNDFSKLPQAEIIR